MPQSTARKPTLCSLCSGFGSMSSARSTQARTRRAGASASTSRSPERLRRTRLAGVMWFPGSSALCEGTGMSTITVNREPLHSRAVHGATGSQTRFPEHITGKDRPQWHSSKRARLVPMYRRTSNWPSLTEPKQGRVSYNIRAYHGQGTDLRGTRSEQGPASSR